MADKDRPSPSPLARHSLVRLLAEGLTFVFGMATGVITARALGPEVKGVFSSLSFLGGLFMQVSCAGLQEASIVMIGQKRASTQEAVSATTGAILVTALLGTVGLWSVCALQFAADWPGVAAAVFLTCAGLPVAVLANALGGVLNSLHRIGFTSCVLIITSALAALGSWLFLVAFTWSLLGAALAVQLATLAGLVLSAGLLIKLGFSIRPRWDRGYLTQALKYGVPAQASYLLGMMSARLDLLLVYGMMGQAAAGYYSVALTVGVIVGMAPAALSLASFPYVARMEEGEGLRFIARLFRRATIAGLLSGVLLALAVPLAVPLLFGSAYLPSVWPSIILAVGGVFAGGQWVLARAVAARGNTRPLCISYGVSLMSMCALDVVLIPKFGIVGAAMAASISTGSGLGACVCLFPHGLGGNLSRSELLPRAKDFFSCIAYLRTIRQ